MSQHLLHRPTQNVQDFVCFFPRHDQWRFDFQEILTRATKPEEVDDLIREMIKEDRAVIADVCIDPDENCFPMIPSGAAHNEIIFAPDHGKGKGKGKGRENGMVLV